MKMAQEIPHLNAFHNCVGYKWTVPEIQSAATSLWLSRCVGAEEHNTNPQPCQPPTLPALW